MKKYLVPLLVLVLLLVSVTTVLADRLTHVYNDVGVCTFVQHPGTGCETVLDFYGGKKAGWAKICAVGFPVLLKENGNLTPFVPDWDSDWKCKGEGTYYVDSGGVFGGPYITLDRVILTDEITTP